jgi:ribose transport system ATP-binding protein
VASEGAAPGEFGSAALLELEGIGKSFPGVRALDGVSLCLARGEVLGLVGENGAGKSTLGRILAGIQSADAGVVRLEGEVVSFDSVRAALDRGVVLIHQELNLAENLDAAANVLLGRELRRGWLPGGIDFEAERREAARWMAAVGLDVDPRTIVEELPIGQRQLIEVAKALSVDARVLIMDEPTSSLSEPEVERLFEVVRSIAARGVSVIYISHRLREIEELCDRVLVLRDGRSVGELGAGEISRAALIPLMVGREITSLRGGAAVEPGEAVLEVRGLRGAVHAEPGVDLLVRAGEIVGLAGLVGAGRSELLATVFGVEPALGGSVLVGGVPMGLGDPRAAMDAGVALVPEDRKQQGLVMEMSVRENTTLATIARDASAGFMDTEREVVRTADAIERLAIKTPSAEQEVRLLSGGNQQKVVIGRWLATEPRVLLMDEPTRGVDVGAKQEIYRLIEGLAADGMGVLFASSEMEEVLGLADRVLVMHEGRLVGEVTGEEMTEETVMQLATGSVEASS